MIDDIVTRLRAYNIGNIAHEASSHMEEMLYEAADEIERWQEVAYRISRAWSMETGGSEEFADQDVQRTYEEVRNG